MLFVIKTIAAGMIIAFTSWLAGRKPVLAGLIVALPLLSMLSILFSYAEYRNMQKINEFAVSILIAVPLSLVFFLPFLLNRWLKMNFFISFSLGVAFICLAYGLWTYFSKP